MRLAPLIAAGTVAIIASCTGSPDRVPVRVAEGRWHDTDLSLDVGSCNGNPTVEVQETLTQVAVEVKADAKEGDQDACMDVVKVRLGQPLGDRLLIDSTTKKPVTATRSDVPLRP